MIVNILLNHLTICLGGGNESCNVYKIFYSYIDKDTGEIVNTSVTVVASIVTNAVKYVKGMYEECEEWHLEKVEVVDNC